MPKKKEIVFTVNVPEKTYKTRLDRVKKSLKENGFDHVEVGYIMRKL